MKLSAKYLPMVWGILHDKDAVGPAGNAARPMERTARAVEPCRAERPDRGNARLRAEDPQAHRHAVCRPTGAGPAGPGPAAAQLAAGALCAEPPQQPIWAALRADNAPAPKPINVPRFPGLHADASPRWAILMHNDRIEDADLVYPAGQKARYQKRLCRASPRVFPDTFVVSERGRYWPDNSEDQGRFLSAGYHNTAGYYRDDTALQAIDPG